MRLVDVYLFGIFEETDFGIRLLTKYQISILDDLFLL